MDDVDYLDVDVHDNHENHREQQNIEPGIFQVALAIGFIALTISFLVFVNEQRFASVNTLLHEASELKQKLYIMEKDLHRMQMQINDKTCDDVTNCGACFSKYNANGLYCDCQHLPARSSCIDFNTEGYVNSGIYQINFYNKTMSVYCDQKSDGGGWLVFQRRTLEPVLVDFNRGWTSYKEGFGDVDKSFWLGNDFIHLLTSLHKNAQLRIDITDWLDNKRYAQYGTFAVSGENTNYELLVSDYTGNAGDSMEYHNHNMFSSSDRDNDADAGHCSRKYHGGWWFGTCHHSNLNGVYFKSDTVLHGRGIQWMKYKGWEYSLKHAEMKLRF